MEMQTGRFVVESFGTKYRVVDMLNGRRVRFSYSNPPLYETSTRPADIWQNFYCALGFCQKMTSRNDRLSWPVAVPMPS